MHKSLHYVSIASRMMDFVRLLIAFLVLTGVSSAEAKGLTIKGIRFFSYPTFTRIVFEAEAGAPYVLTKDESGRRLALTAHDGPLVVNTKPPSIQNGVVRDVEVKAEADRLFIYINLDAQAGDAKDFVLPGPDRIVIDISKGQAPTPVQPAQPKIVVIDPGHGGGDPGIVFSRGLEKDITLDMALNVKKMMQKNAGLKIEITREKDQTTSLDDRAAIVNSRDALLFISLHLSSGTGVRVFIHEPDPEGAPKSSAETGDFLGFDTVSEQQEMLWGAQQASHMKESAVLGRLLSRRLSGRGGASAVQAPLSLLKSIDAPAALVEIGVGWDRKKTAEIITGVIEQYARENR